MSDGLAYLWREFIYGVTLAGMTLGVRYRMEGRQNIPKKGPALLLANHCSFIDPMLVGLATPRHVQYFARANVFRNRYIGAFLRSLQIHPIDRDGVPKETLRTMVDFLRAGKPILLFPEGTRSPDGEMRPFKPGVSFVINRVKPPIIPVGIAGTHEVLPRGRNYPHLSPLFLPPGPATTYVSIGQPLDGASLAKLPRDQQLQTLFDAVQSVAKRAETRRRKA